LQGMRRRVQQELPGNWKGILCGFCLWVYSRPRQKNASQGIPLRFEKVQGMPLASWQVPVNPVESQRSGGWHTLRCRFLEKHPECSCCGKATELEAHHVVPVHLDPSLELEESNLIALCQRCHLVVGHLNSWFRHNKHIRDDAALLKSRHRER